MPWDRRTSALLVAAGLLGCGAAFVLKAPCSVTPWEADGGNFQFRHFCYSDILILWHVRDLPHKTPYLEAENEYPVLSGLYMWGAARLGAAAPVAYPWPNAAGGPSPIAPELQGYLVWAQLGLLAAAAFTGWALWRIRGNPLDAALWFLLPAFAMDALTNFDLLAVALAMAGWLAWRRGHALAAALLFGLGGAAKIYPAFFLPALALAAWRSGPPILARREAESSPGRPQLPPMRALRRHPLVRTCLGGAAGLLLPNLAILLASPRGWWGTYAFHMERSPGIETPYHAILYQGLNGAFPHFDWGATWNSVLGWWGLATLVAALAWTSWGVGRRRLDPLVAGTVVTCVFLLGNRVYSPQYTLWVIPLALASGADRRLVALLAFLDTAEVVVLYNLFLPAGGLSFNPAWDTALRVAVTMRWLALLWVAAQITRRHGFLSRQARPDSVPL